MEEGSVFGAASAADSMEDDEHGSKEAVLLKCFLKEWELVKSILDRIVANDGVSDLADVYKIRSIVDKYQEQGPLLEPYLETLISPLMLIIRSRTIYLGVSSEEILEIIKPLCIIIYSLVTVCGYKSVVRFFPHQVSDLELAVSLLEKCNNATSATSLRQESTGEMEAKCIILLWLYILVLIPFDISSIDSSVGSSSYSSGSTPSPLVLKLLGFSKHYLSNAGPMRKISGLLLSRLLTRPDMPVAFQSFIDWATEVLSHATDEVADHFRLLGVLEALASVFKVGSRKILLNVSPTIWSKAFMLTKSATPSRSPLLRKFLMKLCQRVCLVCLSLRPSSWHYMTTRHALGENASQGTDDKKDSCRLVRSFSGYNNPAIENYLEEEHSEIPEVVEEIIELLLSGLRDSDTVVRWSSAKGIGRITSRLTSSLSEDVLSAILELFSPGEGDGSWHGGCLALAELARRGLLLPINFPKVVPVIIKALHYDIRRGPHSVGSHVRDAAAYVCWAFGRAYSYRDMKAVLDQLAPHLMTIACYDREVNCRRAAAAAFQENVGRQGAFLHGIDIINTADYFSLASRTNSYLHVAVCIAQYNDYLSPFVEELLYYKIAHWEKSLRELASQALSAIAKYNCEYFAGYVLAKLLPCTLSSDLCMRHGATLATGELILALHQCGFVFPADKHKAISGVVPAINKARLYRGKGGEIMRSAVSRFIECISLANIALPDRVKMVLHETLNENLKHPNAQIQNAAVTALKYFVPRYLVGTSGEFTSDILSKYLSFLDDPNVAARRGAALALGVMPAEVLTPSWTNVLRKLSSSCKVQDDPGDRDAESRVNAVVGLVSVCEILSREKKFDTYEEELSLYLMIKNEVIGTLLMALDDYSVDKRGDVGSWVREAAMDGLERCAYILGRRDSLDAARQPGSCSYSEGSLGGSVKSFPLFDGELATCLIAAIAKQAVEKIDKIRDTAARSLQRLLHNQMYLIPSIPHRAVLEELIPNEADFQWSVPALSFPRFVQLLQFACYSKSVLSGLVISVGGLQDSLRKTSTAALLQYIQVFPDISKDAKDSKINAKECALSDDLIWILKRYQKLDRVIVPTLKTIDILFSKKIFLSMGPGQAFVADLMDSLEVELKTSKDFTKLGTGLSILGYISSSSDPMSSRAFSQLLLFLGHRYPKIRKCSADQLYLVLLQNSNLLAEDKVEIAVDIITETCWEGDMEETRYHRLRLCEMAGMGSTVPQKIKESANHVKEFVIDENMSYSSLVGSSGF